MSRLFYSEEGRVLPSLCEELTVFRRARKTLALPATAAPASLYILARCYPDNDKPLHLQINGGEVVPLAPQRRGVYAWHEVKVAAGRLLAGDNQFELWTETAAMNGWSLAIEPGSATGSALSDDGGKTWRRQRMAYLNVVPGEYVVRVRLAEGEDPPPPAMVWEKRQHPRVESLRRLLPAVAAGSGPALERVRALSAWLASSWEHTNSARAHLYSPWDAETVLAWGPAQAGHNGKRPIAMCVHYAAVLVSCAQAAGIPARCAVLTEAVNGANGHFVAEVWVDELEKWIVVDPNSDALFVEDGVPMSMAQIQARGTDLRGVIEYGPGSAFQRTFPHMVGFLRDNLEKGLCFGLRSVWYRSDLLSRPELSPPGHGSLSYCETGLVWEQRDLERGMGMFPHFGDGAYFDGPPAGFY